MSYTSIYAVYKTKVTCLNELRNSHGSGPAVWDYISLKCNGVKFPMFEDDKKFWKLWKDERLSDNERAVLLSTYDNGIIEVDKLNEFSHACEELHDKIIKDTKWEWNHYSEIGKEAKKLFESHDYRCLGMGIGCTSVCDPWEFWNPKDKEPWAIYSSIDSLKNS